MLASSVALKELVLFLLPCLTPFLRTGRKGLQQRLRHFHLRRKLLWQSLTETDEPFHLAVALRSVLLLAEVMLTAALGSSSWVGLYPQTGTFRQSSRELRLQGVRDRA